MPRLQVCQNRHVGVVVVNVAQPHLPPPHVVIPVYRRQVPPHRRDQIVVNRRRHAVGKQRRLQRARIVSHPGIVHVPLHRSAERRGQRVFVAGVVAVVLMKRRLAHRPLGRVQQRAECGVAQFDPLAGVVRDRAKIQVGVVQLPEDLPRGLRHFGLHGQQLFFLLPERVRLEPQQSLQQQPVGRQRLGRQKLLHPRVWNRQDFWPDIGSGLAGPRGHVDIPPLHPLITAVGRVFRGFQVCVSPQPFARSIERLIERQTRRQRFCALAQLALEISIPADPLLPSREGLFPSLVAWKQARKIPGIGGFDFAARRKLFDGGHRSVRGLYGSVMPLGFRIEETSSMSVDPRSRATNLTARRGGAIPETLRAYLFTSPGVYAWEGSEGRSPPVFRFGPLKGAKTKNGKRWRDFLSPGINAWASEKTRYQYVCVDRDGTIGCGYAALG